MEKVILKKEAVKQLVDFSEFLGDLCLEIDPEHNNPCEKCPLSTLCYEGTEQILEVFSNLFKVKLVEGE